MTSLPHSSSHLELSPSSPRSIPTAAELLSRAELRYSTVWEDDRVLVNGLRPGPGDSVLSIASAGDNVFALLLAEPRRVLAVDMNPAQIALVQLKLAALAVLEHREFLGLLGLSRDADSVALYERVRPGLPVEAQSFWDANESILRGGIAGSGRLERYFAAFREEELAPAGLLAPIAGLFTCGSLAEQRKHFDLHVRTAALEQAFERFFGRLTMAARGRSFQQLQFVHEQDIGARFWRRFVRIATSRRLSGNFYLASLLTGAAPSPASGPMYLHPAAYPRLRSLAGRVGVETASLQSFLPAQPDGAFSRANLSDVFEYLDPDAAQSMLAQLARVIRPRGRLAWWERLVARGVPPAPRDRLRSRGRLARRLHAADRTGLYGSFHIEDVIA